MADEEDRQNYRAYAQDGRYDPLVQRGVISSGQACVLRELEKIDGTQFQYAGPETRPDLTGQLFRDNAGREANALFPRSSETVQYDTPENKRDTVDPRGGALGNGTFETRHYDNVTDTRIASSKAIIRGGAAEPAGTRDAIGTLVRNPNERERVIHERTQACYTPKTS